MVASYVVVRSVASLVSDAYLHRSLCTTRYIRETWRFETATPSRRRNRSGSFGYRDWNLCTQRQLFALLLVHLLLPVHRFKRRDGNTKATSAERFRIV